MLLWYIWYKQRKLRVFLPLTCTSLLQYTLRVLYCTNQYFAELISIWTVFLFWGTLAIWKFEVGEIQIWKSYSNYQPEQLKLLDKFSPVRTKSLGRTDLCHARVKFSDLFTSEQLICCGGQHQDSPQRWWFLCKSFSLALWFCIATTPNDLRWLFLNL